MRKLVIFITCIILMLGCEKQNENIENYIDKIALLEDAELRFQQYSEFPFNQDWFKSRNSIELKLGKPKTTEESEGITQWNETSKDYILKYRNMDIYGYITTDREEVYRIDLYDNIWGE